MLKGCPDTDLLDRIGICDRMEADTPLKVCVWARWRSSSEQPVPLPGYALQLTAPTILYTSLATLPLIYNGVEYGINFFSRFGAGAPGMPIVYLVFIFGFF